MWQQLFDMVLHAVLFAAASYSACPIQIMQLLMISCVTITRAYVLRARVDVLRAHVGELEKQVAALNKHNGLLPEHTS